MSSSNSAVEWLLCGVLSLSFSVLALSAMPLGSSTGQLTFCFCAVSLVGLVSSGSAFAREE